MTATRLAHTWHTFGNQIDQAEPLTGISVRRADVDRGCRGHKVDRDGLDVIISNTRGLTSPTIKREMPNVRCQT
jgi:IS5 family transposase